MAEVAHMEGVTQQTLHYTLANQAVQQVQIHRIGEDGQVQVVSVTLSSPSCPTALIYLG